MTTNRPLSHSDLLQLKRWNTPTIYNGWEQITKRDYCADGFNIEETRDFMPQMGPMVGYAVTVVIEPSNSTHRKTLPNATSEYREYLGSVPGPKIVVITDGPKGAHAYDSETKEVWTVPMYPDLKDPVDRTGAGDAFASTVVAALALGKPLADALEWGPINSMSVVQEIGAQKGLLSQEKLLGYLDGAPKEYKVTAV